MAFMRSLFFSSLFLFVSICSFTANAQGVKDSNGLITIETETPSGTVKVYLPKNFVDGKPVSGTIEVEPKGDKPKAKSKNAEKLKKYTIDIGGKTVLISEGKFTLVPTSEKFKLLLKDDKKQTVQAHNVGLTATSQPGEFAYPEGIKSTGTSQIYGEFDGDTSNTEVKIAGQNCKVLAESPVQVLFEAPKLNGGPKQLQVTENKEQQAAVTVHMVSYALAVGKLNLKRGESTWFQATITGLSFIEKPVPFVVTNLTPGVVILEGGNFQRLMIPKQDANYVKRWSIRSIKTGTFTISTELILPDTAFPGQGLILGQAKKKDPCEEIKKRCDALLVILNQKKAAAKIASDKAIADKALADAAQKTADDLEQAAQDAALLAIPQDKGGSITMDEHTYYLIDNKMRELLAQEAWNDYQAGNMDANGYQDRLKELQGPEALKEIEKQRERLEAQLREAARQARIKADQAKLLAQQAKAKADASQKENLKKQAELTAAQTAYNDCMKQVKIDCDKVLAKIAKDEADRKAKLEAARLAAEKAKQDKIKEENRIKAAAERDRLKKEELKYQLKMIKELDMLGGTGVSEKDIPGIWDWIPEFMESPVTDYATDVAEGVAGGPIPLKIFNAIGEVYKLFGSAFDPCTKFGKDVAIKKLQKKINPVTNKNYEAVEALAFVDKLCNLLRDIRVKMQQVKKLRGGK